MAVLGPSLVLLHLNGSNSSVLEICGHARKESVLSVGSLARSNLRVGVVSGVVGRSNNLLVSLVDSSSSAMLVNGNSQDWLFEGVQCWFELQEELGFDQFSVVWQH